MGFGIASTISRLGKTLTEANVVASALAALFAIGARVVRLINRPWAWYVCALVIVAAVVTWRYFDYRIHNWSHTDSESGWQWTYTDYIYRGRDKPFYREGHTWGGEGPNDDVITISFEGSFSETGKKHGHWQSFTLMSGDDMTKDHSEDEWYWYGEQISEGEWHLRNK